MGLPGMVKPMSEPGLQGSPLAFVDGGTLCNFPLHIGMLPTVSSFMGTPALANWIAEGGSFEFSNK